MIQSLDFSLLPQNKVQLANLCGENDSNINHIAEHLGIDVYNRGYDFRLVGEQAQVATGAKVLKALYRQASKALDFEAVHLQLVENFSHIDKQLAGKESALSKTVTDKVVEQQFGCAGDKQSPVSEIEEREALLDKHRKDEQASEHQLLIRTPKKTIRTRGSAQQHFVEQIRRKSIAFGVGPAGTGKTFLAVAAAIEMLTAHQYERLIITRPAVEAGEKLGFLPGDFSQKVDPYLRPVFDALYEMLGFELTDSLISKGIIEIAPLAFMRGRSFNQSFVLLDEGQNTTVEQMKMFLTRMGFGSQVVVTGDPSQVDLPEHVTGGLSHALRILSDVPQIHVTRFAVSDIVRHALVQSVVRAYAQDLEKRSAHKKIVKSEDERDEM